MILKDEKNIGAKVPKTLHATVGKRLSIEDIKKMSAKTTVHAEFIDADELAIDKKPIKLFDNNNSQEVDADDLVVDD